MTSAAYAFVILMMRTDVLEDVKHVKVIMSLQKGGFLVCETMLISIFYYSDAFRGHALF